MDEISKIFEEPHIQKLQEERERIQQKTFTKWMNSHLIKINLKVDDIFKDLRDGKILMNLLEVITNVDLGKYNRGTSRVQNIENVNKSLKYIQSKVNLKVSIDAEDIVDGNHRLILGLIWTIILRFQIQEMIIETESGEKKSSKEALLLWCQRKTKNYKNVDIKDFHKSWSDGLAFNALIHDHCPELIDYDKIVPANPQKNLNQAFTIAEKELRIPTLLDPEDVGVERPDVKSIMTYVSSLYLTFAKMKTENTGTQRVVKNVSNAVEIANMIEAYENLVRSLLQWIQKKIIKLNDRNLPNLFSETQKEMLEFKTYQAIEKPQKNVDRSKIAEKFVQIIEKQKENKMENYVSAEGLLIKEVEVAWDNLEKAEHEREMILRLELLRQDPLDRTSEIFKKIPTFRINDLNEISIVFNNTNTDHNIQGIEAQIIQGELIGNEIHTAVEAISYEELILKMNRIWQNEKCSPTLLRSQTEVTDIIMSKVFAKQELIEKQTDVEMFIKNIQQHQIERIKYVVIDYHRVRLQKIHEYTGYYLKDPSSALNPDERNYANIYDTSINEYVHENFGGKTSPLKYFKNDYFAKGPDLNKSVSCHVLKDLEVTVNENLNRNSKKVTLSYVAGDQFIAPFRFVEDLVNDESILLIK